MISQISVVELLLIGLMWAIWIGIGGYAAKQKRRNVVEGMLLGCLGPIGVVFELLLPTNARIEQ